MADIAKIEFHIEVSKETLLAAILDMKDELRDLRAILEKIQRAPNFYMVLGEHIKA